MKKMLRIILCAVLTLTLVFSFVACSDDAETQKTPEEVTEEVDHKADAKKAVKGFMDAYCEMDIAKMSEYCLDGEAFVNDIGYETAEEIVLAGMRESEVDEEMIQYMNPFAEGIIDIMKDCVEYKIVEVKEDGDDYVATVEYSTPDFQQALASLETIMSSEETAALGEEIALELVENGTITQNSTEEEIMEALMNEVIARILPEIAIEVEAADIVENTVDIKVVEKNGKWYVDQNDVDFVKEILG